MEALKILNEVNEQINRSKVYGYSVEIHFNKAYQARVERAIKELETYITNYQAINRRLDNTITTLAVLQSGNESLVTILEKMNKEIIDLRKENQVDKGITNETTIYITTNNISTSR